MKGVESDTPSSSHHLDVARWGHNLQETEELEDWATEWKEVLAGHGVWGGRTRGGRGVAKVTGRTRDVSVDGVTLAFCGKELLQRTSLKFMHNRRYGIIGENGVGKSTLLRRIARRSIPGLPLHFRIGYVQQEQPLAEADRQVSVWDFIMRGVHKYRACVKDQLESLREEEERLDALMESTSDTEELSSMAEELCSIAEQIETLELAIDGKDNSNGAIIAPNTRADLLTLGEDVVNVLDGLGLSRPVKKLSEPLSSLSGGWRARAALAQCLTNINQLDLLLLDEPTNHLDLPTVSWLESFLTSKPVIVCLVSHDRAFLNAVCTDIVEMKDLSLSYFPSTYEDYLRNKEEMSARKQNALDARARKESHIQKTIDVAQARGDDRLVKTKNKKLERAAFTRSLDGHRFKLFSLHKLDENAVHMPEIIEAERERYQAQRFKFPLCDAAVLRLSSPSAPIVSFEKVGLTYAQRSATVLQSVSFALTLRSRVGIVGRNGQGKSSLLQAIAYAETTGGVRQVPGLEIVSGTIRRHHQLVVGVVAQHQIDALSQSLAESPLSLCLSLAAQNTHTSYIESEMRAHLGAFGLSGSLALQTIGSLSGGQKARLSFAIVCLSRPHLLLLDEPSNHLSLEAIDSLIAACQEFSGAVVVVSHNKHFLSKVCSELFVIDNQGTFAVRKPEWSEDEAKKSGADGETGNSTFVRLLERTIAEQCQPTKKTK